MQAGGVVLGGDPRAMWLDTQRSQEDNRRIDVFTKCIACGRAFGAKTFRESVAAKEVRWPVCARRRRPSRVTRDRGGRRLRAMVANAQRAVRWPGRSLACSRASGTWLPCALPAMDVRGCEPDRAGVCTLSLACSSCVPLQYLLTQEITRGWNCRRRTQRERERQLRSDKYVSNTDRAKMRKASGEQITL